MRPAMNTRRPGSVIMPSPSPLHMQPAAQPTVQRNGGRPTIAHDRQMAGAVVSQHAPRSPDLQGRVVKSFSVTPTGCPRTQSPTGTPTSAQMPARASSLEQGGLVPRGSQGLQPRHMLGCVDEDVVAAQAPSMMASSQTLMRGGPCAAGRVHSGPAMANNAPTVRRAATGTPGGVASPGGMQVSRDPSVPKTPQVPQSGPERLQFLHEELSLFTNKMEEMRTAAVSLQEEVLRESLEVKPTSASSGVSTALQVGPSGQASTSEPSSLADSWVLETLKRTLLAERSNPVGNSAEKEVRLLRQEIRMEGEARRQLGARMDATAAILQEEKKKREEAVRHREEADAKLEQKWHATVKEEGSLRRAVESHLEARLGALQREMRLECGAASQQAQQVCSEFSHMRENLRQEMELQKKDIANASSDLSRLVDQLRMGGPVQPAAERRVGSESLTEGLVRAEVRRQLMERSSEPANASMPSASMPTTVELQAMCGRIDRLEKSLENEAAGRQEENSKMVKMFQEILAEARQHQDAMLAELEQRLQAKLEQVSAEVQEEVMQRRTLLAKESKDREESCMAILKSLEDQLGGVGDSLRRHEKELQHSLETTAAAFAEKNIKEMMTTRQDLLELREELQEVARNGRENLEEAVVRMNAAGPSRGDAGQEVKAREELWTDLDQLRGELRVESATRKEDVQGVRSSLDRLREQVVGSSMLGVEELQNGLKAERLAREQGDSRCMEALQLLREDRQNLGKEPDVPQTSSSVCSNKDASAAPAPYSDFDKVPNLPRPATSAAAVARSPGGGWKPQREAASATSTAPNLSTLKPAVVSMTHPSFSA